MTGRHHRRTDGAGQHPASLSIRSERELRYEILEGRVHVTIAGSTRTYRSGEIFIVPADVRHLLRPVTAEEVPRVLRRFDATAEEEIEWPSVDLPAGADGH